MHTKHCLWILVISFCLVQMRAFSVLQKLCRLPLLKHTNLISKLSLQSTIQKNINIEVEEEDLFTIELPSNENNNNLLRIRHTSAHIMAMAVQNLFPEAKVTIGPWIDNGFVNYNVSSFII